MSLDALRELNCVFPYPGPIQANPDPAVFATEVADSSASEFFELIFNSRKSLRWFNLIGKQLLGAK